MAVFRVEKNSGYTVKMCIRDSAWAVSLPVFMDRAMVFWVTSSCNMNPSLLQKIQDGS